MKRCIVALALLAALAAAPAAAAPQWKLDPPHCQVVFTVRHIFAPVSGRFRQFSGAVSFDPKDLAHSRAELVIQTASIDTDVKARDEHLRSEEFFDVKRYPQMRFVSQRMVHKGGNQYAAIGTLTMRDVSRRVELPFTHLGTRVHPQDPKLLVAGFEANFTLDRLQYHVGNGRFFKSGMLDKDVRVSIHLELLRPR
ncbi:MAG: YceI family protein [Desulfarculus sp.]|jgi:polyisoprenoid-binding protein YceI|nr:MAG: YceI family protein [Desulfarculus sp.]